MPTTPKGAKSMFKRSGYHGIAMIVDLDTGASSLETIPETIPETVPETVPQTVLPQVRYCH